MSKRQEPSGRSHDRFLIGIVVGILLLVGVTLVLALTQGAADYVDEGTPLATVQNYMYALKLGEYERAYQYLSPEIENYPSDWSELHNASQQYNCQVEFFEPISLREVERIDSEGLVFLEVDQTIYSRSRSLFDSGSYTRRHHVTLQEVDDQWQIVDTDICAFW